MREGSVEAIIGTAAAAASQRATGMEWDESPRCKAKGCCIWRPLPTNDGAWMCSRLRVKQKQVTGDVDARCLRRPGEVLLSGNGATQASEFLVGETGTLMTEGPPSGTCAHHAISRNLTQPFCHHGPGLAISPHGRRPRLAVWLISWDICAPLPIRQFSIRRGGSCQSSLSGSGMDPFGPRGMAHLARVGKHARVRGVGPRARQRGRTWPHERQAKAAPDQRWWPWPPTGQFGSLARRSRCSGTQPASRALWLARRGATDACTTGGVTRKPGWLWVQRCWCAGLLDAGRRAWSVCCVFFLHDLAVSALCQRMCQRGTRGPTTGGLLRLWPKATWD